MKVLSTDGLTKLIQLIKNSFISVDDTVTTNTATLATVATSGSYNDLSDKPIIATSVSASSTNAETVGAKLFYDTCGDIKDKNALNKQQITNCLLEVPQRIKLELNDGTLTLKAGSQIIVPNGFEADGTTPKFDYVDIKNDVSFPYGDSTTNVPSLVMCVDKTGAPFGTNINNTFSGETEPTISSARYIWYDTTTNLVKTIFSSQEWISGLSLPIANVSNVSGKFTSINQVFNGMGYIGSTVWVDKGVKGLAPNGRNEDGSLKNTEIITTGVTTRTLNTTGSGDWYVALGPGITWSSVTGYIYDEEKNMSFSGGIDWSACIFGRMQFTNGVITTFQPKLPFRAVDYNDVAEKRNNLTQTNISLSSGTISLNTSSDYYSITPTSNTTFTFNNVPSGVCTFELRVKLSTAYTLTFPSSVKWMNNTPPDMSETGVYFLVFRTEDNGNTWYANCQGKWSI